MCGLCDQPAEEVEIRCNETGQKISVPVCDTCLLESDSLTDFVQAKFDVINGR